MFGRTILAAAWLVLVFAAAEADARSGHAGGGRAAPRSLQRYHQAPAVKAPLIKLSTPKLHAKRQHATGLHAARQGMARHATRNPHRRSLHRHGGYRWPFVFTAPYVPGDDFVVPPAAFAEIGGVPPGEPVIINSRQCFVQPHIVPVEGADTVRTVTVTRCY